MRCFTAMVVLIMLLLSGCGPFAPEQPAATGSPAAQSSGGSGNGSVTGTLVDEQNQPIANLGVFLADLKAGPGSDSNIIVFNPTDSKRGTTDEQGRFTIQGIEAGSYSLAVWTPNQAMLVPQPGGEQGSAVLVEIENGGVADIGTIKMPRPR